MMRLQHTHTTTGQCRVTGTIRAASVAAFFIVTLGGCSDKFVRDKETVMVSYSDKTWLVEDEQVDGFSLVDDKLREEQFALESEWSAFNRSASYSGMLGLDREMTEYEVTSQRYISDRGSNFAVRLEATDPPQGTIIKVGMNNIQYWYDLRFKKVIGLATKHGNIHYAFWDGTYELIGFMDEPEIPIVSTVTYHDTMTVGSTVYQGVMEFTLKDFQEAWEDSTVTGMVIARRTGLLQYSLNNGLVVTRK
jgi:hypothetical protein